MNYYINKFDKSELIDPESKLHSDYNIFGEAGNEQICLQKKNSNKMFIYIRKYCNCCGKSMYVKKGEGINICSDCNNIRNYYFQKAKDTSLMQKCKPYIKQLKCETLYYNDLKTSDKNTLFVFCGHYKISSVGEYIVEPQKDYCFAKNREEFEDYTRDSFFFRLKLSNDLVFKSLYKDINILKRHNIPQSKWISEIDGAESYIPEAIACYLYEQMKETIDADIQNRIRKSKIEKLNKV